MITINVNGRAVQVDAEPERRCFMCCATTCS